MASDARTAIEHKEEGNKHFKNMQLDRALDCYSKAIARDSSNPVYFSNRAQCLIRMGLFHRAIPDAERAICLDSTLPKYHYRLAMALSGVGEHERACSILEKYATQHADIPPALERERVYLQNSKGVFDLNAMLRSAKSNSVIDIAEYIGPVTIRMVEGKGRGLFVHRDIKRGDFIFVSKAALSAKEPLSTAPKTLPMQIDRNTSKLMQMLTQRISRADALMLARFSFLFGSKICSQPISASVELYSQKGYGTVREYEDYFTSEEVKRELASSVFDIVVKNQTSAATVTYNLPTLTSQPSIDHGPETNGIWFLHSFFNHSCLPNVFISHAGDFCIARANSDIGKGTELTRAYVNSSTVDISGLFTIKERREELKTWQFTCHCELCEFELDPKNRKLLERTIDLYERTCQFLSELEQALTTHANTHFKKLENLFSEVFAIAEEIKLGKNTFNDTVWTVIMKLIYRYGRSITELFALKRMDSYFRYIDKAQQFLCEKDLQHETRFWYIYMQILISVGALVPSASERKKLAGENFDRVKALQMYF